MKQGQRRSKTHIERDRREIARLYLRGEFQADIGERLGLSQQTVSNDLKVIQEQWRIDRVDDIHEMKNIESAKIDALELTYYDAWERSKEKSKSQTEKRKGSIVEFEGEKKKTTIPIETQLSVSENVGNPAFLQGVERCVEKRIRLWGLESAKKLEHSGAVGLEKTSVHVYIPENNRNDKENN